MPQLAIVSKLSDQQRAQLRELLPADWSLLDSSADRELLARQGAEVEVVYGNVRPFELSALPRLRWVQATWAGVENLLYPELIERGVLITNVRGVHATAMSEHTMAGLLWLARDLPCHVTADAAGSWRRQVQERLLADSSVLLLGTGAIAQVLIPRLQAFGCRLIGVNSDGRAIEGCEYCLALNDLRAAPPAVDFAVCMLPCTDHTRGLLDGAYFARAPQPFGLVNISRGGLIVERDLLAALDAERLTGAVLDVTDPEPPAADSPLFAQPRVLLTGHRSGSPRGDHSPFDTFRHNLERWLADDREGMHCRVDPTAGY